MSSSVTQLSSSWCRKGTQFLQLCLIPPLQDSVCAALWYSEMYCMSAIMSNRNEPMPEVVHSLAGGEHSSSLGSSFHGLIHSKAAENSPWARWSHFSLRWASSGRGTVSAVIFSVCSERSQRMASGTSHGLELLLIVEVSLFACRLPQLLSRGCRRCARTASRCFGWCFWGSLRWLWGCMAVGPVRMAAGPLSFNKAFLRNAP